MTLALVAFASLAAWIYLAVARGGFWRARETDAAMHAALASHGSDVTDWPRITAVIPARNEADLVGITVGSLLAQRYPGALSVVVVDDHSDDGTADVARAAAAALDASDRLTVLSAAALPPGWGGKMWAVSQGVAHVEETEPASDYLLLTDADIRYEPDALPALVFSAIAHRRVLTSLMVALRCESAAERALIPAFVFFFQMLYPFSWANQPDRRTAAAAGGCMLVRRDALRAAGGIAAIRDALIDDCALARVLKPHGPTHLALGARVESLRPYPSIHDIRRMVARTAYAQLGFSPLLLVGVALAMLVVFVVPVVAAVFGQGWTQAAGIAAWALMALLFQPMLGRYRVSRWWGLALPGIAAAYLAFTIESGIQHLRGRGGLWKGRTHGPSAETP